MNADASTDRKARHDLQVRQVRAGCSGCLVFLLLVLLCLGGFKSLEQVLHRGTLGSPATEMVILGQPEKHSSAMLWIGSITLISLVAALNVATTGRALWRVSLVLGLGVGALVLACYTRFLAVRALREGEVALVFLWPRPEVRVDARYAVVGEDIEVSAGDHTSGPMSCLVVGVDGTTYRSETSGAATEAKRFLLARGAKPGR